jgi:hypothetical protein
VDEHQTAIVRPSCAIFDVFDAADDKRRPGLSDRKNFSLSAQTNGLSTIANGKRPIRGFFRLKRPSIFNEIVQQKRSTMFKAVFLALAYLIGMSVMLALRPSDKQNTAAALTAMAPSTSTSAVNSDDELNLTALSVNTWSKADKLPVAFTADEKKKVPVEEIRVTPVIKSDEFQSKPEPKHTREVTSWHWHAGSKNIERH